MRLRSFILLLIAAGISISSKNIQSGPGKLNGKWIPVRQEMGGTSLPEASFETQVLIIEDSTYAFVAESVDKGIVKYNGNDKMDVYGKDGVNAGKHFTALYKYENEELSICYNLKGDVYPETFETKGNQHIFFPYSKKK